MYAYVYIDIAGKPCVVKPHRQVLNDAVPDVAVDDSKMIKPEIREI